jgi:hypothetical protein
MPVYCPDSSRNAGGFHATFVSRDYSNQRPCRRWFRDRSRLDRLVYWNKRWRSHRHLDANGRRDRLRNLRDLLPDGDTFRDSGHEGEELYLSTATATATAAASSTSTSTYG